MTANPDTDAVAFFGEALNAARQAAADAYDLADTANRLWERAVDAQGSLGGPVGLDDLLAHAAMRGGEPERAQVQALLSRYLDHLTTPEPEPEEEPEP